MEACTGQPHCPCDRCRHKYKVKNLVTNVEGVGCFTDPDLCNPTGIAEDSLHNLWIANLGNGQNINPCVTHYDLYGVQLIQTLPFIDYVSPNPLVPPSQQRQLMTDLFWLQKNILYYQHNTIIPMPSFYVVPPIIGNPAHQPSPQELALDQFLNKPNG